MNSGSYQLFEVLKNQGNYKNYHAPIIIADHIRTPENMGSILRLAGNIGVANTLFISDVAHTFKNYKINKTASGAAEKVDWQIINKEDLMNHIPGGYQLIALETTTEAKNIYQFSFPKKVAFIVGNEVSGISDEIISMARQTVFIPIPGQISSLNVSHALSITLFEWLRQMVT